MVSYVISEFTLKTPPVGMVVAISILNN